MVVQLQIIDFHWFIEIRIFDRSLYSIEFQCNAMYTLKIYMVVLEILHGRFMNFRFDSICNITQEPQQLYRDSIAPVDSLASLFL